MSEQAYYVPDSSKLPFAMALTLLVFIIGAANTVIDMGTESNSYLDPLNGFCDDVDNHVFLVQCCY